MSSEKPALAKPLGYIAMFLFSDLIFWWLSVNSGIQFEWEIVNKVLGPACVLIPSWAALMILFYLRRWWSILIGVIAIIPLIIFSGLGLLSVVIPASEKVSETDWRGYKVRCYRRNVGAMTKYGLEIRQERVILPGLILPRRVDYMYGCSLLDIITTDTGIKVLHSSSQCEALNGQDREYALKPNF